MSERKRRLPLRRQSRIWTPNMSARRSCPAKADRARLYATLEPVAQPLRSFAASERTSLPRFFARLSTDPCLVASMRTPLSSDQRNPPCALTAPHRVPTSHPAWPFLSEQQRPLRHDLACPGTQDQRRPVDAEFPAGTKPLAAAAGRGVLALLECCGRARDPSSSSGRRSAWSSLGFSLGTAARCVTRQGLGRLPLPGLRIPSWPGSALRAT
jgi:hypothetical protein